MKDQAALYPGTVRYSRVQGGLKYIIPRGFDTRGQSETVSLLLA